MNSTVQLCCTIVFKNVALYQTPPKLLGYNLERENTAMSDSLRNAGFFAGIGVILAILIISTITIAGFKIPSLKLPALLSNKGRLTVLVTDKPADLKHLNITIDQLLIQKSDGENITLELKGGSEAVYFDLLALQDVTLTLSETEIPTGNYTMIRMHVLTANATRPDGTTFELAKVPSEWIKVLLKPHLIMQSDGAITVTIDLEPDTAQINISQSLNLKPTMKAMING